MLYVARWALMVLALSLPAGNLALAQSACAEAVRIERGDTLSAIARQCQVTLEALVEANAHLDDVHRLSIGDRIVIPGPEWDQASGYVVGPGDTLGSIASELRLPASTIVEANPGLDAGDLAAGLVLRVPAAWADGFDAGQGPISTSGVITTVECPAIRGPDGRLYALAGAVAEYQPGDRVEIEGERTDSALCVPGPAIEISEIRSAG